MTSQFEPDPDPSELRLLRIGRIYLIALLAMAVAATAFMAPAERWYGIGAVGVCLLGLAFLQFQVSLRTTGWTAVALGLIVSALPEFLPSGTLAALLEVEQLDQAGRAAVVAGYFQEGAAMLFALGLPIILLNRTETRIDPKVEVAAGIVGLLTACSFAVLLIARPSAIQSGFLVFAVTTVLAGAADVAPEKWKKAIAAAALLLAVEMYLAFFHTPWLDAVRADLAATWRLFVDNTYPDTLWAMLFGGGLTALNCANARLPWRRSLAAVALVVTGIWILLVTVAAGL